MSKNEINELVQRFSAMTEDEVSLMLTVIPSQLLFAELMRRDAHNTQIVKGMKEILAKSDEETKHD